MSYGTRERDTRERMVQEVGAESVKEQREHSRTKNNNTRQLHGVYSVPFTLVRP